MDTGSRESQSLLPPHPPTQQRPIDLLQMEAGSLVWCPRTMTAVLAITAHLAFTIAG